MSGVDTNRSRAEMQARKEMQDEDHKKIFGGARAEAERIKAGGTDFALFNLVLSMHSFKGCNSTMETLRLFYVFTYTHIKRLERDIRELDPNYLTATELAKVRLEEVAAAARKRSKENKYGKRADIIMGKK